MSLHFSGPRTAQSILGKISVEVRQSFPDGLLRSIASDPEPLDPNRLPGRRSCRKGKYFFRSTDCSPAPSTKRKVVNFR
jgi:hypothetical protein